MEVCSNDSSNQSDGYSLSSHSARLKSGWRVDASTLIGLTMLLANWRQLRMLVRTKMVKMILRRWFGCSRWILRRGCSSSSFSFNQLNFSLTFIFLDSQKANCSSLFVTILWAIANISPGQCPAWAAFRDQTDSALFSWRRISEKNIKIWSPVRPNVSKP